MENKFRAWLESQPRSVTQGTVARDLGVHRTYVNDLMADDCQKMPSLRIVVAIEKRTRGKVTAQDLYDFALVNQMKAKRVA